MDIIDLPLLLIDTSLKEAIGVMRDRQRSGVVAIEGNTRYWLFEAAWVVVGISRREEVLADIEKRWRVHILKDDALARQGIDLRNRQRTEGPVEQMLDSLGKSYGLAVPVPKSGQIVRIITRHEYLAAEVGSGPADCYCSNPNRPEDPHLVPDTTHHRDRGTIHHQGQDTLPLLDHCTYYAPISSLRSFRPPLFYPSINDVNRKGS